MEKLSCSPELHELAKSLAKAQGKIKAALKDSDNSHFKSKFADLASAWDACREPLSEEGISIVQSPSAEGNIVSVTTVMLHSSGQWISGSLSTQARDALAQSVGSAITYLRRYSLMSFVGIAPDDDDGNAAQHGDASPAKNKAPKTYSPAPTPIQKQAASKAFNANFDKSNTEQGMRLYEQLKQMGVNEDYHIHILDLMDGRPMTSGALKSTIAEVASKFEHEELGGAH